MKRRMCQMLAALLIMVGIMSASNAMPSYALSKIGSVSFSVVSNIQVGGAISNDNFDVSSSSGNYSVSEVVVQNAGFSWGSDDVPEIKVYLSASSDYYFNITKASQIHVSGATYKSSAREDNATTLVVDVTLPSLATQAGKTEMATLSGDGTCSWDAVPNCGSYEVRFTRGNTKLGGNQSTTSTSINCSQYMTKEGVYQFSVRAINTSDVVSQGEWVYSNQISIDASQAATNSIAFAGQQSAGTWINTNGRWWFSLPDNSYPAGAWREINGVWYYFDSDGYMHTGWLAQGDKWYYLDPVSGAMWKNTTSPDGYPLSIDGSWTQR